MQASLHKSQRSIAPYRSASGGWGKDWLPVLPRLALNSTWTIWHLSGTGLIHWLAYPPFLVPIVEESSIQISKRFPTLLCLQDETVSWLFDCRGSPTVFILSCSWMFMSFCIENLKLGRYAPTPSGKNFKSIASTVWWGEPQWRVLDGQSICIRCDPLPRAFGGMAWKAHGYYYECHSSHSIQPSTRTGLMSPIPKSCWRNSVNKCLQSTYPSARCGCLPGWWTQRGVDRDGRMAYCLVIKHGNHIKSSMARSRIEHKTSQIPVWGHRAVSLHTWLYLIEFP